MNKDGESIKSYTGANAVSEYSRDYGLPNNVETLMSDGLNGFERTLFAIGDVTYIAFTNTETNAVIFAPFEAASIGKLLKFGGKYAVSNAAKGGTSWTKTSGISRDAVKGKGNYGLGVGTVNDAMQAGRSWVGKGFIISKDGSSWISANGLRQFRLPSFKLKLGIEQANFQWRNVGKGAWQSNGHFDIIKP